MILEDKEAVFSYRSDADTNQYQGWIPKELSDVDEWLGKRPAAVNTLGTWFQLVIVDGESKQIIGDIGMHFPKDEPNKLWLGCTLKKSAHGRGLATECLRAVMKFAKEDLGKTEVTAYIKEANTPSRNLFERLGFESINVEDGDLHEYFRTL